MDVLLIDDHPILHETVGAVVRSVAPFVQFHAELDLASGIAKARTLRKLHLVLLDLSLPDGTGIEALHRFRKAMPRIRVAILSASEDPANVRAAFEAGAIGYVPKTTPPKTMAEAMKLMINGGTYIPPQASGPIAPRKAPALADLGITGRQEAVLRLLVQGYPNSEIAAKLNIAENTVKQHVHSAYRALGVSSRTEAMVVLGKMGIRAE